MALQVDVKHPIGCYTHKFGQHKSKNLICPANALCAMVHKYDHPAHGTTIDLCGFFADIQHAKKCIENGYFSQCSGITFYAKALDNNHWKLIKVMTKNGIKVTIK